MLKLETEVIVQVIREADGRTHTGGYLHRSKVPGGWLLTDAEGRHPVLVPDEIGSWPLQVQEPEKPREK